MNHVQLFNRSALAIGLWLVLPSVILHAAPLVGTVFVHTDYLGSGVALSDSRGGIVQRVHYLPFGEATVVGGRNEAYELSRFTGKALDPATGLYYFGARYLDPRTGRFLSPDPARQTSAPDIYAGDAPLVNVDPDGRNFTLYEKLLAESLVSGEKIYFPSEGNSRIATYRDILDARRAKMNYKSLKGKGLWTVAHTRELYESLRDDFGRLKDPYEANFNATEKRQKDAMVTEKFTASWRNEAIDELRKSKNKFIPTALRSKKAKEKIRTKKETIATWSDAQTERNSDMLKWTKELNELGLKIQRCEKFIEYCTKQLHDKVVNPVLLDFLRTQK